MLVALIGKANIYKILLPKIIEGNYWIKDPVTERKFINIEAEKGKWKIALNDNIEITEVETQKKETSDTKKTKPKDIILKEDKEYIVRINNTKELFALQCFDNCDNKIIHLNIINKDEIFIGNSPENDIRYNNPLVAKKHAQISLIRGKWMIHNLDYRYSTFINNKPILDEGVFLDNGDVIFIMGLKIVMMGKSIFINNPQNRLNCKSDAFSINKTKIEEIKTETTDNEELQIKGKTLFRTPRATSKIELQTIKIDGPPEPRTDEEDPLILTLGTSISMSVVMIISAFNAISGLAAGTATGFQTATSLLTSLAMLVGMLILPIARAKYREKKKERDEENRQKRYKEYLKSKSKIINEKKQETKNILFENYISTDECTQIVFEKSPRLLERKAKDRDFLKVRLGIGDIESNIKVEGQQEKFSMIDDNLLDEYKAVLKETKTIEAAPIVLSLVENNILSILINESEYIERFLQSIIIQLITLQNFESLKLVFLLEQEGSQKWEYVKMLPHVWDNKKEIRFFADNYEDTKKIARYLEEEYERATQNNDKNNMFTTYYLIITDCYPKIKNLRIIREILNANRNRGFGILDITQDLETIPNECRTIINVENDKQITIFKENEKNIDQQKVNVDTSTIYFFEKICKTISNVQTNNVNTEKEKLIPNNYTFLDMYEVNLIEQLNALERWSTNDPTTSLKALIGFDETGMPISLDIHEKFHGPHGLIAGSTGSGKSEFIITYILSLAINYHPDDINFVLIDYKGGGLAGAFQKKDMKLPHLVGTITNIDTNGLQRSLVSIQSELKRRQVIFSKTINTIDEGTLDIYKYQKLYHEGKVETPLPHLLIICDEFAELKQQQPEFMDELISVSRIGRSLGMHLILATQKPNGIVNGQIKSNSKFAVCLKVQEKEDSNDVIKRPDAANLKKAGQFYLQVGNDEYFVLGQSGWAGAPYIPIDENVVENEESPIVFIDNTGTPIKEINDVETKIATSQGEQLTNILKYLDKLAKQNDINTKNLWLEDISKEIFLENIRDKYKVKNKENIINPVIGEYDDPYNQEQGIVNINLSNIGNTIIYGNAESGKETLLSTLIFDIMNTHTTEEVNLYLLDFGSEALKVFKDSPHVGDIVYINDNEKIFRLLNMIQNEIKERKEILSDYNGDYKGYLNKNTKPMPMIVIVLNNYEAFDEMYKNQYDEIFASLTREGTKYGIVFVATASTYGGMKYRLTHNFKSKIALQLNKAQEYSDIFENIGKRKVSNIFGRGLITIKNGNVCEFQTAKICEADKYYEHIKETIKVLNEKNKVKAKEIPTMPDKILLSDLMKQVTDLKNIPIGIVKENLRTMNYNFKKNFINIITAKNIKDAMEFSVYVLKGILTIGTIEIKIFNNEKLEEDSNLVEEFEKFISDIQTKDATQSLCVIMGISKFIKKFKENDFEKLIEKAKKTGICNLILVESANRLKELEYSTWYKNLANKDNGIWVGNGIDNQYIFSVSNNRMDLDNNCGRDYGYVIKQNNATLIKLLEMRENNGDE